MKRINPKTGTVFKMGDTREDGYVFWNYKYTSPLRKDGTFQERWYASEKFKDRKNKHYTKNKQYQKDNLAIFAAKAMKRIAAKIKRTPKWLTSKQLEEIAEYYDMAKQLETVFPWKQHVDHIIPLQGEKVSGLHVPENLQILSKWLNLEKSNKYMDI